MKRTNSLQVIGPQEVDKPKRVARIRAKVKPTKGYAYVLHLLLSAILPVILYVLVKISFVQLAIIVVLLSKWRILAVRPRFWPAIVRANAVDASVNLATVIFMSEAHTTWLQLFWMGLLIVWQVIVKPGRTTFAVSSQAIIGQTYGLGALFLASRYTVPQVPLLFLVLASWLICYLSARHFLANFDEPHAPLYANAWGYFAAALVWISVHWLLYYGAIAQPVLLLSVLGFSLGGLYYLQEADKLSDFLRRQIVLVMIAVVVVVFVFSSWGSKIV